ncbi:MAG: hypothetical protein C0412_13735 [Flavobacterium sp.]|nr:hypothetical protein [Flavobacterium sp.]
MKYLRKILLLTTASLIFFNCKGIVDPPEKDAAVYGTVTDQNDNILSGVNVHYIFNLGIDVELRNASISYSVPSNQLITMQIYNMNNIEIAKPVDKVNQLPGNYTVFFDGNNLTNGLYRYKISGQSFNTEGIFSLLTNDINKLVATTPLLISDNSGEFKISYKNLGIGKYFGSQNGQNQLVISDSIRFVLHKTGYQDLISSVKLDTTKVFEKTFKMVRNN